MRGLLSLFIILSSGPMVFAQDKGKAEFSPSAEYRVRYWWTQNPGADGNDKGAESKAVHRFKIGTLYRANERFTAGLTLLHNATWGLDDGAANVGEKSDVTDPDNLLLVNEAYANWMTSEDFNIRFGRQAYQIADGYVIGTNDWTEQPYSFEGVLATYESEVGRFQGFIFKLRDMGEGNGAASASKDPEHNAYGLNFDLKAKPEWVKAVNFHIIKDSADAIEGGLGATVNGTQGQEAIRYGLMSAASLAMFDGKVWFASHTGKNKLVDANTKAKSEREANGMMFQAEVSTSIQSIMDSRIFVQYHYDSGDSVTSDDKDETYDPYLFERHDNAGLMDLVDWGNLTYLTFGWNGKLSDKTEAGALYTMFSRTETKASAAGPNPGINGGNLDFNPSTTYTSGDQKIGDELDVWVEHKYEGGLSTMARLGYFTPGEVIKNMVTTSGAVHDDNIIQLMLQGKMTF